MINKEIIDAFKSVAKTKNIDRTNLSSIIENLFINIIKRKYGEDYDNFNVIVNLSFSWACAAEIGSAHFNCREGLTRPLLLLPWQNQRIVKVCEYVCCVAFTLLQFTTKRNTVNVVVIEYISTSTASSNEKWR